MRKPMIDPARFGPWALVTGAASGLGKEFSLLLAESGFRVFLIDCDWQQLSLTQSEVLRKGAPEVAISCIDLTSPGFLEKVEEATRDCEVGLLVNNAGIGCPGPFHRLDPERLERLVNLNCLAPVLLTRLLLPGMMERRRGGVLFVSSMLGFAPNPFESTYDASKSFNLHLGESLWGELRNSPVEVLTLCPPAMMTDFFRSEGLSEEEMEKISKHAASPRKMARLALRKLGKKSLVYPPTVGAVSFLARILPRTWMTRLMGRLYRKRVRVEVP